MYNTPKLINKHNQELVHVGCNDTHFVPYTKAYLIFGKFIFQEQNNVEFNDLRLNDNVTILEIGNATNVTISLGCLLIG